MLTPHCLLSHTWSWIVLYVYHLAYLTIRRDIDIYFNSVMYADPHAASLQPCIISSRDRLRAWKHVCNIKPHVIVSAHMSFAGDDLEILIHTAARSLAVVHPVPFEPHLAEYTRLLFKYHKLRRDVTLWVVCDVACTFALYACGLSCPLMLLANPMRVWICAWVLLTLAAAAMI